MIQGDQYRDYFKYLCAQHPELTQQDADQVFGGIDIEDSFGDFRLRVEEKSYIFRLINYTYGVGLAQHENHKHLSGGWVVAHYFGNRQATQEEYYAALAKAEKVNDEFIERIISDSEQGHPLWYHSYPKQMNFNVQPIRFTGDASYCGYRTIISWSNYFRVCIDDPAAPAWLDGGITSFEL